MIVTSPRSDAVCSGRATIGALAGLARRRRAGAHAHLTSRHSGWRAESPPRSMTCWSAPAPTRAREVRARYIPASDATIVPVAASSRRIRSCLLAGGVVRIAATCTEALHRAPDPFSRAVAAWCTPAEPLVRTSRDSAINADSPPHGVPPPSRAGPPAHHERRIASDRPRPEMAAVRVSSRSCARGGTLSSRRLALESSRPGPVNTRPRRPTPAANSSAT